MENFLSDLDPLLLVGIVLVILGFLSLRVAKWVTEKIIGETEKFILFLWRALHLVLMVVGFGSIGFGCWLIWPSVVKLVSDFYTSVFV